ncbi:MAG: sigma-70 family RNA polymerase sigma factor [Geodermatophilaceae bacterium]|nr:sigma-70 family RNA polymerase sigma factor [Geodermatophilaceae bacterium]
MALMTRAEDRSSSAGRHADVALVGRLTQGDTAALEQLYDRYGRPAYSLARRILADDGLAEDVVQEVFLALWRQPERFDADRGAFSSWLLTMTHHKAVDAVRREETLRRRRSRAADEDEALLGTAAAGPDVDDQVIRGIQGDGVRRALLELPDVQREALTLAYFGGYTQREVAALTGAPLGTVKTRMLAGMRRLKDALGGMATSEFAFGEGAGL